MSQWPETRRSTTRVLSGCLMGASLLGASAAALSAAHAQGINLGLPAPAPDESVAPAAAAHRDPAMGESVAAKVNDDIISSYDLKQRMRLLVATTGVQPTEDSIPQIEREAMRSLVDEHLEMQEVKTIEDKQKDLKLEPTDAEIDQTIGDMAKQSGISRSQLVNTLKSDGVDLVTLREQIRAQMSWNHYIGARFRDAVAIGDNQVKSALEEADAASLKPQYELSEIFIDASHVGGQTAAEDGAKQLIAQIQQGAPFAAVAHQFSSLTTAANGGDIGWVAADELKSEVRTAVEQMRPGSLSQPIETTKGVYIVMLRQKREGTGSTVVDLRQAAISLPQNASPEQVSEAETKLNALRKHANTCEGLQAEVAKSSGVVSADLGETEVKDLRPAFQKALDTLKVDEISQPIRTDVGLHVIAVCSRHAAGVAGVTKADITDKLRGEQLSMFARRFLRDLRNSATIETR
jgi:peptidyl-prolyl cis-trans isomerase SurA